jgi:sugar lactone lactonase YvrE
VIHRRLGHTGTMGTMKDAMGAAVVATGLPFGAGPTELSDGSWLIAGLRQGWLWKVDPASGRSARFAEIGSGVTAAVAATDGGAIIAQADRLTRVGAGGASTPFASGLRYPADLVVAPDGVLWVAEGEPDSTAGRLLQVSPAGDIEAWADEVAAPHGLARLSDGSWLVTAGDGLLRILGPGHIDRSWVVGTMPSPGGGLCVDEDDNAYVAGGGSEAVVRVVSAEGAIVDTLRAPVEGAISDCAFVGSDRRTLLAFVPDAGVLVAWDAMPIAGQRQPAFVVPAL